MLSPVIRGPSVLVGQRQWVVLMRTFAHLGFPRRAALSLGNPDKLLRRQCVQATDIPDLTIGGSRASQVRQWRLGCQAGKGCEN
jgi:hypothetical protein